MKIIYYSSHPNLNLSAPSGPGTHMREVIKGFEKQGHIVVKCILGGEKMDQQSAIQYEISPIKKIIKKLIPNFFWQSLKDYRLLKFDKHAYNELLEIVDREKPDLIYERGFYLMTSGVRCAKDKGVKHYIEINAPYPEEKIDMEGKSMYLSKSHELEGEQVRLSNKIIVVSSALKQYLTQKHKIDESKILVTPNAVNIDSVITNSKSIEILKKELMIDDQTVIGFVGSIFPYHGVDKLIYAFEKLLTKNPQIKLLIVGDGESLPELRKYVLEKNLGEKVIFTGNVAHSSVYNHIDIMDITVMATSNWYGSPVKIFEYGIMRKAIIAPNNIPVKDAMMNGQDGILVDNNESQLLDAMKRLIDSSELRTTLAESFYNKVKNKHTWLKVSESILSDLK